MGPEIKVLFVDDQPFDVMAEQYELTRSGIEFSFRTAKCDSELKRELREFRPDVVLCDYNMPGYSGIRALQTTHSIEPTLPVLMVSGTIAESTAIKFLDLGATDYLLKSNLRRLGPAVRRAIQERRRRQAFETRIEQLAHYDALTGLPNRLSIERRGAAFLNDARFNRSGLALLILNVDDVFDFDQESTLPRSDDALKHIGKTLLSAVPDPTCVARTGVDEFVLLVPQSHGADEVGHFAQRLLDSLARPQLLDGRTFKVCATAGVALFPEDGDHMDALLGKARAALRAAQAVTPGGYQFHLAEITQRHRESRQLENELREAISGDSLTLKYQPQFDVSSGRVCGVEALTRWTRADGRVISPSVFIPLAEKCRSIEALGQWALRASCKTFASWPSSSIDAPLCVNVSVEQIAPRFTEMIREALLESGLRPDRLELEITESVLVGSTDHVLACLNDWKRLGVRIAIDDFGTGYSNLAYLSKLPIDRLKIDKSLTARVPGDHRDSTVVRTVISLARELGFTVLAEGIENEEQLRAVTDLGCHQVQGFLFAPPLTAPQALELMTSRWGLREQASIPA